MYGQFLKVIKHSLNLLDYEDDTDLLTALVEVLQETQTSQSKIAAMFVAFKEIRQLVFGIERECIKKPHVSGVTDKNALAVNRDRDHANICEIASKDLLNESDNKNDNKNTTSLITSFSNPDPSSALFNHEKCFCRHQG